MPSTAAANQATAILRREMLARFLAAIDAFHADEQTIEDGRDPGTGAELTVEARAAALDAATARLTTAMHGAIDTAWTQASATARQTLWAGAEAPAQAQRVLESETTRQKAFASRFALDVARGETEEGRKIPEGTRAAMYSDAAEAGFQVGAALGGPDGDLIWWVLGEVSKHCLTTPEARVWTARGDVPICEVVVGDEVMTHRGRFMPVTAVHAVPVEETSTNLEITFEAGGHRIGLTGDHVLLTESGWECAGKIDCIGNKPMRVTDADLRAVWPGVQVPGPYDLPGLSEDVRVRSGEVPQGQCLHQVRYEGEGGPVQGGAGRAAEACGCERGSHACDLPCEARREDATGELRAEASRLDEISASTRGLQAAGPARPVCGAGSNGGRPHADGLPVSLAVGAGERPGPGRHGDSPPERGPDGRPDGEPPDALVQRAQEDAPADGGRLGREHRLSVRHVRDGVPSEQAEERIEVGEAVLRPPLPGSLFRGALQGSDGDHRLRDVRGGVSGETVGGADSPDVLASVPVGLHDGQGASGDDDVRGLRGAVCSQPGIDGRSAYMLKEVHGAPLPVSAELQNYQEMRRVRFAVQTAAIPAAHDLLEGLREGAEVQGPIRRRVGTVRGGALVYDLTVADDHTFIAEGFILSNCYLCPIHAGSSPYTRESLPTLPRAGATPCRSKCKCHLTFRPAKGVPPPITPEEKEKGRRFDDRIVNPPPTPPGKRLPTAEERGVLRDLEIQRNFARRKQADAEAAGRKDEARLWQRKSSGLTGEIMDYSKERGVHHVPTFSVKDVINGRDLGQRDIDRLTHFRGIDGVTVSRAQVAAIHEAVAEAKANVLKELANYPAADAVSREEWRQLLRENGAPPSAFGGELFRLGREACEHGHEGELRVRTRPALGVIEAIEAKVPEVTDEVLPNPADVLVVNLVGESARETLQNHVEAYALLGGAGRRTGVEAYRVELGPLDDGWEDAVSVAGTWVQGDAAEVVRFLEALRGVAADFAVATWQPMG